MPSMAKAGLGPGEKERGRMLMSHKFKFIFVKTLKTAGTSIEVQLSEIMATKDVVTPIFPIEENHIPRNYEGETSGERIFYNHMPAREIRDRISPEQFQNYFKFCVEREPVDKCISQYYMMKNSPGHKKGNEDLTWDEYIERGNFPVDHEKYLNENGALLVDRIVKYENLNEEIAEISKMLGFNFDGVKVRAKSGFRGEHSVTPKQRDEIYEAFATSLAFTNY